jgi:hypothetical protein
MNAMVEQTWCPPFPDNGWPVHRRGEDGWSFFSPGDKGLYVIYSGEIHDGKKWLHVSMSRRSRMPSYDDVQRVRKAFIGIAAQTIMVWPPDGEKYINFHPYCLHLYSCVEGGDGLPDFSQGTGHI